MDRERGLGGTRLEAHRMDPHHHDVLRPVPQIHRLSANRYQTRDFETCTPFSQIGISHTSEFGLIGLSLLNLVQPGSADANVLGMRYKGNLFFYLEKRLRLADLPLVSRITPLGR